LREATNQTGEKMAKAKYKFEDFFVSVDDNYKDFVMVVHEMLLQKGYRPKVQFTKSNGVQVSYSQPKIKVVKGIVVYLWVREEKLMVRINADNHAKYPQVLNRLPENIVSQVSQADDCIKMIDPQRCWQGCMGYDFHIGGKRYQKCYTNCFLLEADPESVPFLLELIESESEERRVV